ncbi:MAG: FHA domain-containing protein, partial [Terriglobales bacterium]
LDTKKAKEMMAAAAAAQAQARGATGAPAPTRPLEPQRERTGILTVLDGKTDQKQYLLGSKLTVIGKSDMASIKLKGWFAPNVAATINKRDNKYFIAPSERKIKLKINAEPVMGQRELAEGDTVEVEGVKMSFDFTA